MARRWLALGIAAMAAVATALLFVVGASANLPPSTFEGNDGNLVVKWREQDWDTPAPNLSAGERRGQFGDRQRVRTGDIAERHERDRRRWLDPEQQG